MDRRHLSELSLQKKTFLLALVSLSASYLSFRLLQVMPLTLTASLTPGILIAAILGTLSVLLIGVSWILFSLFLLGILDRFL